MPNKEWRGPLRRRMTQDKGLVCTIVFLVTLCVGDLIVGSSPSPWVALSVLGFAAASACMASLTIKIVLSRARKDQG